MRSPQRLLALLLPLAILACSSDDDDSEPTNTRNSERTDGTTPDDGSGGNVSIPSESQVIEVEELGVEFAAPAGWETVDPDELESDTTSSVLDDLAERAGVTPEELAASIEAGVELYVFSTEPEGDYTPNINILAAPANALPTDEQITAQFEELDANNIQIERTTTAAGTDAVGVSYTVRTGELRVRGVSVFTEADDGVVNITASSTRRRVADELGELILASVGPIE